jgi:hypothetical protein
MSSAGFWDGLVYVEIFNQTLIKHAALLIQCRLAEAAWR